MACYVYILANNTNVAAFQEECLGCDYESGMEGSVS